MQENSNLQWIYFTGGLHPQIEGTGIGLTICKNLIEMMEGSIGYESNYGEGSYFYIDLPVSKALPIFDDISDTSQNNLKPIERCDTKKILYFDDIPANVELVRQFLRRKTGVVLIAALNTQEGLEIAKKEEIDLILMDIHMPEIDGFTAFKYLQEDMKCKDIPVIAITADAMSKDIKKALDMGFKDYITKPINVDKFLKTIDDILI